MLKFVRNHVSFDEVENALDLFGPLSRPAAFDDLLKHYMQYHNCADCHWMPN